MCLGSGEAVTRPTRSAVCVTGVRGAGKLLHVRRGRRCVTGVRGAGKLLHVRRGRRCV